MASNRSTKKVSGYIDFAILSHEEGDFEEYTKGKKLSELKWRPRKMYADLPMKLPLAEFSNLFQVYQLFADEHGCTLPVGDTDETVSGLRVGDMLNVTIFHRALKEKGTNYPKFSHIKVIVLPVETLMTYQEEDSAKRVAYAAGSRNGLFIIKQRDAKP